MVRVDEDIIRIENIKKAIRILYCVVLIFLCGAFYRGAGMFKQYKSYKNSRSIDQVTIIKNEVERELSPTVRTSGSYRYYPKIVFEYEIEGVRYTSDRYQVSDVKKHFMSESEALDFTRRYPVGMKTNAYYDSSSPDDAFLVIEHSFDHHIAFMVFNLWAFLLVLFCWFIQHDQGVCEMGFIKRVVLVLWWFLVGLMCFGYYFKYAEDISSFAVIISVVYAVFGVLWVSLLMIPRKKTKV